MRFDLSFGNPHARLHGLARVVGQELDVPEHGEVGGYGQRSRPGIIRAPLALAIHGEKHVACGSGKPILAPLTAVLVGRGIDGGCEPNRDDAICTRSTHRLPVSDRAARALTTQWFGRTHHRPRPAAEPRHCQGQRDQMSRTNVHLAEDVPRRSRRRPMGLWCRRSRLTRGGSRDDAAAVVVEVGIRGPKGDWQWQHVFQKGLRL